MKREREREERKKTPLPHDFIKLCIHKQQLMNAL